MMVEYAGTMVIICQMLTILEIPSIRIHRDKIIAVLKYCMWTFTGACAVLYTICFYEFRGLMNYFMVAVTVICLEVLAFIYCTIIQKLKTSYNKAYQKLSRLLWICMSITLVIYVARIVYHILRLYVIDVNQEALQKGGKIYKELITFLFPMIFQVAPIIVLNQHAMIYGNQQ